MNRPSGGIGFVGLLTIVFVILKLTGVIDWSWWWVWSPIEAAAVVTILLLAFIGLITVIENTK